MDGNVRHKAFDYDPKYLFVLKTFDVNSLGKVNYFFLYYLILKSKREIVVFSTNAPQHNK